MPKCAGTSSAIRIYELLSCHKLSNAALLTATTLVLSGSGLAQTSGLGAAIGSAETQQSVAEAKQVAIACKLYATDHEGRYPTKLNELIPDYLSDKKAVERYDCLGGRDTEAANAVLLRSKFPTREGRRIVVHSDTSVEVTAP